jgi:hypothetical protein
MNKNNKNPESSEVRTANTTHLHEPVKICQDQNSLTRKTKKLRIDLEIEVVCEIPINQEILDHAIENNWNEVLSWKEAGDEDYADATEESTKAEFLEHYDSNFCDWIQYDGMSNFFNSKNKQEIAAMISFNISEVEILAKVKESAVNLLKRYNSSQSHLVDFK